MAHVTEYAILAARSACGRTKDLLVLVITTSLAATDEYHQSFVASRTGSPIDVMTDATGAAIGLSIYWLLPRRMLPA